jgi:hypothetical protein
MKTLKLTSDGMMLLPGNFIIQPLLSDNDLTGYNIGYPPAGISRFENEIS